MTRLPKTFLAFAAVLLLDLTTGCKPKKAGDKCLADQELCTDKASALTCGADGKFFARSCRGPAGCVTSGADIDCDDSLAQETDGCDEDGEAACSTDKKSALECASHKFVVGETCKGAGGCTVKGNDISCDNDVSDDGDPCHFDGDYACTTDKLFVLKCTSKKMTKLNSCRGAKGCRVFELPEEKKIDFVCDDSLAQLGDACDEPGEHACSMDKKSLYACKGTKFELVKACTGPKGCTFDDKAEHFDCDSASGTGKPVDVTKPQPSAIPHTPPKK